MQTRRMMFEKGFGKRTAPTEQSTVTFSPRSTRSSAELHHLQLPHARLEQVHHHKACGTVLSKNQRSRPCPMLPMLLHHTFYASYIARTSPHGRVRQVGQLLVMGLCERD